MHVCVYMYGMPPSPGLMYVMLVCVCSSVCIRTERMCSLGTMLVCVCSSLCMHVCVYVWHAHVTIRQGCMCVCP
jgi:hypothetical protein